MRPTLILLALAMFTLPLSLYSQASVPSVDHHTHLFTAEAFSRTLDPVLPAVKLPGNLAHVLTKRQNGWNEEAVLADLFTEDALMMNSDRPGWVQGRTFIAERLAILFSRGYRITPVKYEIDASSAYVAGYFSRGEGKATDHFGQVLLSLKKENDGVWRIAAETLTFPGPAAPEEANAAQLLKHLDAEGIKRAVVLSTAYWFGSGRAKPVDNEYEKVRAENDWVAKQVGRFPDRIIGFCSFNPLKDYALEELKRCVKNPNLKGLKLHFGDSKVDMLNPKDVEKARAVFRAANESRFPIVIDLWTGEKYGREHSLAFLNELVAVAPDIPIQIAHLSASGPGYHADEALQVYAEAAEAGNPRMRNVYFDVASIVTYDSSPDELKLVARRIRQLGVQRVLYGSDRAGTESDRSKGTWDWRAFRKLPLTEQEFQTIAGNLAPYMR